MYRGLYRCRTGTQTHKGKQMVASLSIAGIFIAGPHKLVALTQLWGRVISSQSHTKRRMYECTVGPATTTFCSDKSTR